MMGWCRRVLAAKVAVVSEAQGRVLSERWIDEVLHGKGIASKG